MKYTEAQLETMRKMLAERDSENMDGHALYEMCLDGCPGWRNTSDEDLIDYFEDAEGDDYFEVIEEKDNKNNLYGEEI